MTVLISRDPADLTSCGTPKSDQRGDSYVLVTLAVEEELLRQLLVARDQGPITLVPTPKSGG